MGRLIIQTMVPLAAPHGQKGVTLPLHMNFDYFGTLEQESGSRFTDGSGRLSVTADPANLGAAEFGEAQVVHIETLTLRDHSGALVARMQTSGIEVTLRYDDTKNGAAWTLPDPSEITYQLQETGLAFRGSMGADRVSLNNGVALEGAHMAGRGGNDHLTATMNDDVVLGHRGNDKLIGLAGDDLLRGFQDHDVLIGNYGDDTLRGGQGRDRLIGGAGDDVLTGGHGRDVFVFRDNDRGEDHVTDFNLDHDRIAIRGPYGFDTLEITDHDTGAMIHLADGTVTLDGIDAHDLTADLFLF
ncbi:calcium-binding protein [Paracoccaceae bacterium GXU_MW_L88]